MKKTIKIIVMAMLCLKFNAKAQEPVKSVKPKEPKDSTLNEVQIIGYGETTKRKNTGSVSTITAKQIENQPVTNVLSALSGQSPGVFVQTTNGLPGGNINIQIRGKGSITAGTNPLYIIDGIPFASKSLIDNTALSEGINGAISPLNSINPADIESINILKDADATAIYGSRGANGVVLITTKKGKSGKLRTDISISQGIAQVSSFPKLLNLSQYLQIRKEAFKNDGTIPSADPTSHNYAPDLTIWDTGTSTNWAKYMLGRTGTLTNIQTSLSGGDASNRFMISSAYRTESSVLPGDNRYSKGGLHISSQHNSADNKFHADVSVTYNTDNNRSVNPFPSQLANNLLLPPNFPLYDQNGNFNWLAGISPLAQLLKTTKSSSDNVIANALLSYQILPGLTIKTSAGLNKLSLKQTLINPKASQNPQDVPVSSTTFGNNSNQSFILEPQLNYNHNFKASTLAVLIGGTYQNTMTEGTNTFASNFSSESLLENMSSASTITAQNSYLQYKYVSVFGRITYNLKEKYILNASIRRDGSSRFGPANRFGNFGALGVAWIFTEEHWLQEELPFLSFGKLRASYGITGSDQISDYQYLSLYGSSGYQYQNYAGLTPYTISNADFKWESNKKLEFGLELSFLKDRINFTVSRYQNRSGNQLISYALPYLSGFYTYQANLPALIQNTGWEFEIHTKNIQTPNFSWSSSFNLSTTKNVLKSFPNIEDSGYSSLYKINEGITRIFGFPYVGADPTSGQPLYQTPYGEKTAIPPFETYFSTIGDNTPKFFGGLGNTFTYKKFTLDVFAQFARQTLKGGLIPPGSLSNNFEMVWSRWQNPGDLTQIPKASNSTANNFMYPNSSANFFDTSYLRLKNVSLSYAFPKIRVFAQGQNLLTFWNKNAALYDPESGAESNIPPLRIVTIGLQLTL